MAEPVVSLQFLTDGNTLCRHCGGSHARACPRVKRLVFKPTGGQDDIAEVEYFPWGEWPDDFIIWPEDEIEEEKPEETAEEA